MPETAVVVLGKVDSFARSFCVAACRAGSCDRTKSVFVVRELFWPTRSVVAAGLEVRKDRLGSVVADVAGVFESVLTTDSCAVENSCAVESAAFNCAITASFCRDSFSSACWSLRVSRSFLRCIFIDSGVGALSWLENDRFCEQQSVSSESYKMPFDTYRSYFIMSQSHIVHQIIRDCKNISQNVNLKFIKRLVDRRLKQCL